MDSDAPLKYNWENKTILIVEDVSHNYKFLLHALKPTKANVLWSKNGKDAFETCKTDTQIDLILMDINMPIMNGYKSTRLIKGLNKNIPIITQTAYAFAGEREKSFEAGCDEYILKPIRANELLEIISKYL